jgi:hypothetical protein
MDYEDGGGGGAIKGFSSICFARNDKANKKNSNAKGWKIPRTKWQKTSV